MTVLSEKYMTRKESEFKKDDEVIRTDKRKLIIIIIVRIIFGGKSQ